MNIEQNVRNQLGRTPREIQNSYIDRGPVIEDSVGYVYTGKVVNNNDPDKEGKCQIRVYGIFDTEVPDEDLPWALPDFEFVGSKIGSFIVPPIGALVNVYFDMGDIYLPHYTTKVVDLRNLSSLRNTDYPDMMVFYETDNHDFFIVNRRTGEAKLEQRTGSKVTLKSDGTIRLDDKYDNIIIMSNGEVVIHSNGTVRLDAGEKTIIGPNNGYVVTSPIAGPILTQDGSVLTAQKNIIA